MVRLARLTTVTVSSLTLTAPVGALPRKASESASTASSSVAARTQRLRRPFLTSCSAITATGRHDGVLLGQEVAVQLVERRRHDVDVLDLRAELAQPSQQLHLALGRAGDHQSPLVDALRGPAHAPSRSATRPVRHSGTVIRTCTGSRACRRRSASEPHAISRPRSRMATRSVRASISLSACDDSSTVTPSRGELADQLVERAAQRRVQARGRLVEQQQPRPAEQRLGQAEPLPHALGVGADATAGGRGEADALEQRLARRSAASRLSRA